MTKEQFLKEVCPNHTDKSVWNKIEFLKLNYVNHSGQGKGAIHLKVMREFEKSKSEGIKYCEKRGWNVFFNGGILQVKSSALFGFHMNAIIKEKKMKAITHCIGYKLHKNSSRTVIDCYSEKEQDEKLKKVIAEGYPNARRLTLKQADKFLDWYKPIVKPLTKQEIWNNWALGR